MRSANPADATLLDAVGRRRTITSRNVLLPFVRQTT